METHNSSPSAINQSSQGQMPDVVRLMGPDGWTFSVSTVPDKIPDNVREDIMRQPFVVEIPSTSSKAEKLNLTFKAAAAAVGTVALSYLDQKGIIDGPRVYEKGTKWVAGLNEYGAADEILSGGMLGFVAGKANRLKAKRSDDREFYRQAASNALAKMGVDTTSGPQMPNGSEQLVRLYDPLNALDATHMRRRLQGDSLPTVRQIVNKQGIVGADPKPSRPNILTPRTIGQQQTEIGIGLQREQIARRTMKIEAHEENYGHHIGDKKWVKNHIKNNRMTAWQKIRMRLASRSVRKLEAASLKDTKRIYRIAKTGR